MGISITSATAWKCALQLVPARRRRRTAGRPSPPPRTTRRTRQLDRLGGRQRAGAGDDGHAAGRGLEVDLDSCLRSSSVRVVNSPVLPPGTRPSTPARQVVDVAASAPASIALAVRGQRRDQRGQDAVELRRAWVTSRIRRNLLVRLPLSSVLGGGLHRAQLGAVVAGQVQVLMGAELLPPARLASGPRPGFGVDVAEAPSGCRRSALAITPRVAGTARADRRGSARRSPRRISRSRAAAGRAPANSISDPPGRARTDPQRVRLVGEHVEHPPRRGDRVDAVRGHRGRLVGLDGNAQERSVGEGCASVVRGPRRRPGRRAARRTARSPP